jgi:hypothetical protein
VGGYAPLAIKGQFHTDDRLALRGGFGNLSGRHGHTIDNITNVTVVLADGRVVQASAEENEDVSCLPLSTGRIPNKI